MKTKGKFQGWIASLNTGEEVYETEPVPGERSAWQLLIELTKTSDKKITQLRLIRGGVTVAAMPGKNVDGYYQAYEASMGSNTQTKIRQGIGTVVGDKVYITWVNDQGVVWQDIRQLETSRVHTALKD